MSEDNQSVNPIYENVDHQSLPPIGEMVVGDGAQVTEVSPSVAITDTVAPVAQTGEGHDETDVSTSINTDQIETESTHESKLPETDTGLLALSVIDRKLEEARSKYKSASQHLNFVKGYRPTPPGPRPHSEAGGMDHQDWNVARLEFEQYDEIEEEERAYEEVDSAEMNLDYLEETRDAILAGDASVIDEIVAVERARLAEEAKKTARAEERKIGKEFEGAKELFDNIKAATEVDRKTYYEIAGKVGPSGWAYEHVRGLVFKKGKGQGPMDEFTDKLSLSAGEDSVSISLHQIPVDGSGQKAALGEGFANNTEYTVAIITSDGLVKGQFHYRGQSWKSSRLSPLMPPTPSFTSQTKELDFTQADLDKLREAVSAVKSDMQTVISSESQVA